MNGTFHHQIALFCTVSAKARLARSLQELFSNEIKDLEAFSQVEPTEKSF